MGQTSRQENPLEAAYVVARHIESPFLRVIAQVDVATAFHQAGEAGRLNEVLDDAYQQAEKSGGAWRQVLLEEIVRANLQTGRLAGVMDIINRMHDPLKRETSLSELAAEYARQGKIKEAGETALAISDSATKERAWVSLGKELVHASNFDEANRVYEVLKSPQAKAELLYALGERYVAGGQPEEAFKVFLKADSLRGKTQDEFAVAKVQLLGAIAGEYQKRGDKLRTKEVLGRMARISEQAWYDEVRVQALFETAGAFYSARQEDKFLECLSLASEAAETTRDLSLKIDAFAKAFFWYEKIGDTESSYWIKFKLLRLAESRKNELEAQNLRLTPFLRRDPFEYAKVNELIHIAAQLFVLGDEEDAVWFVKQLDDRFLPEGYARMAEVCLNLKMSEKARPYLDQAIKFAGRVNWETEVAKSETLEKIATGYARLGDKNRALEIAAATSNPLYQVRALSEIGVVFASQKAVPDSVGCMWLRKIVSQADKG